MEKEYVVLALKEYRTRLYAAQSGFAENARKELPYLCFGQQPLLFLPIQTVGSRTEYQQWSALPRHTLGYDRIGDRVLTTEGNL